MEKNLKTSIIISILFVGLIRFLPIWERWTGSFFNLFLFLVIGVLSIWILIKIVVEIVRLIKKCKELKPRMLLPLVIMIVVMLDVFFNPLNIDLEKIYGKVVFRACYEGTQNQATFKLRDNGGFDIHCTGVFFYEEYFTGEYRRHGDTLFMNFNSEIPRTLDDTLIIKNGSLYKIRSDTLTSTFFYLGYCKGLN